MLLLHTSDWHAGRRWRGVDRLPELIRALDGVVATVQAEGVDVVLLTGDVFDTGSPPPAAEKAVFAFLRRVSALGVDTVIIAGNHDDPRRLEAWGLLAELARVRVVGRPREADEGGLIELQRPSGERLRIAAVPFAGAAEYMDAETRTSGGGVARQSYADGLTGLIRRLSDGFARDTVNVVMAHTHVDGAVLGGSERRVHVGEQWAVTGQAALPPAAHYVALGHIHRPQPIPGAVPAEYAGSPLQMDFGEAGDEKSFVLIQATPGLPAAIRRVPYVGGRRLARFEGDWDALEQAAPGLAEAWVRVALRLERAEPNVAARVRALVPGALAISVTLPETRAEEAAETRTSLLPADAFRAYLAAQQGPVDEGLVSAFGELWQAAQAEG